LPPCGYRSVIIIIIIISTHDEIQQHRSHHDTNYHYQANYHQSTASTVQIKIVEWKKRVGDTIRQGDTIAILERRDTKYWTKETIELTFSFHPPTRTRRNQDSHGQQ
jgi:hypothetical protein